MKEHPLTRAQVREVDRVAIEEYGIPGIVLMENAGLLATLEIESELEATPGPVTILCGGGNNGGDGFVVARKIHSNGGAVNVYILGDPGKYRGVSRVFQRHHCPDRAC